jgi:hypothetical protein
MIINQILSTLSPEARTSTPIQALAVLAQTFGEQLDVAKQQLNTTQAQLQATQAQLQVMQEQLTKSRGENQETRR